MLTQLTRGKTLFGFLAVLVSLMLSASTSALAVTDGRQITQYDLVATVRADGVLEVELTFVFDFGNDPGHGPYLEFVRRQGYDGNYDRIYQYRNVRVSSPSGAPADLHTEQSSSNFLVRIGDPDIGDVSGAQTYVLSYELAGMLNDDTSTGSGMDELFWNVLGSGWEIPLSNVRVEVRDDFGVGIIDFDCFAGPGGSTENCDAKERAGDAVVFEQALVPVGSGLTVVTGWPADTWSAAAGGEIAPILQEKGAGGISLDQPLADAPTDLISGLLTALVAWLGGFRFVRRVRRSRLDDAFVGMAHGTLPGPDGAGGLGKRNRKAPVTVRFTPPEGLRPAEAGTLIDEVADKREFTATLIDLAVRGFLVIEEVAPRRQSGKVKDWTLIPTGKDPAELTKYEARLLQRVLGAGPQKMSHLRKNSDLAEAYTTHTAMVNKAMETQGLFHKNPAQARSSWKNTGNWLVLGAFISLIAAIVTQVWGAGRLVFAIPLVLLVLGIAYLTTVRLAPVRTATGSALLEQTAGFERYLSVAEAHKLRFEEGQDIFSRYLPYAVAFGTAQRWSKVIGEAVAQGQVSQQSWYRAHNTDLRVFDPVVSLAIVKSIDRATDKSVKVRAAEQAAEHAATTGSSGGSGFSGRGSSGGGGGGGGGGGW